MVPVELFCSDKIMIFAYYTEGRIFADLSKRGVDKKKQGNVIKHKSRCEDSLYDFFMHPCCQFPSLFPS